MTTMRKLLDGVMFLSMLYFSVCGVVWWAVRFNWPGWLGGLASLGFIIFAFEKFWVVVMAKPPTSKRSPR